jgi:hypothetical protein
MTDNIERSNLGEAQNGGKFDIKNPLKLTVIAIILGFAFEILFFDHMVGISFFILSVLCAIGLSAASYIEGHKIVWRNVIFVLPILFFSFMTFLRTEPLTVFLNIVGTLILFALWVRDFRFMRIFDYGFVELGISLVYVMVEIWVRPWKALGESQRAVFKEGKRRGVVLGVVRGLILALPILVILLILLTSADLIFGDRVREALDWLDIERIAEYAARTIFVIMGTIIFLGAIVAALQDPADRKIIGEDKPILKPFIGFVETMVVLGSIDLLFLGFLAIQFRYLFGGVANITAAGYTFSEYARRGFFELVAVGILSSAIILGLAWWGRRDGQGKRRWFNALSAILVVQVGVILYSSLTRLLLYEEAYGFTRLRTYTHIFIPWMGVVLVANLIFLLTKRDNRFAIPVVLGVIGFVASLNLINVDTFIVGQNVARLEERYEIDLDYLVKLSEDAVPELVSLASEDIEDIKEFIGELACWQTQLEDDLKEQSWPSSHLSRSAAREAFAEIEDDFKPYQVSQEDWGLWTVIIDGEERSCGQQQWVNGW